jgi:hypothetical protein
MVRCLPSGFELYARLWRCCPPEVIEETLWLPRAPVEEAAQLIWRVRPVSYLRGADLSRPPTSRPNIGRRRVRA